MSAVGIDAKLEVNESEATSLCAVVVVGKERTLCASIEAARKFSMDYLNANMVSDRGQSLINFSYLCRLSLRMPRSCIRQDSLSIQMLKL